jgi:plasmid stabilization system protein ParE
MARVTLAQSAQTDLLEAWLFIAEDNQQAADHVLDTIDGVMGVRFQLNPRMSFRQVCNGPNL